MSENLEKSLKIYETRMDNLKNRQQKFNGRFKHFESVTEKFLQLKNTWESEARILELKLEEVNKEVNSSKNTLSKIKVQISSQENLGNNEREKLLKLSENCEKTIQELSESFNRYQTLFQKIKEKSQ